MPPPLHRIVSLFSVLCSLFESNNSLFADAGKRAELSVKSECWSVCRWPIRVAPARFPCIFPANQGIQPETGSRQTAPSASKSWLPLLSFPKTWVSEAVAISAGRIWVVSRYCGAKISMVWQSSRRPAVGARRARNRCRQLGVSLQGSRTVSRTEPSVMRPGVRSGDGARLSCRTGRSRKPLCA